MAKQAVLLLAHGTPDAIEEIPAYLRNVTSGRPLPQHVVEEIQHRYSLIGRSPLTDLTLEQARLTEAELAASGLAVKVYVGMRNWKPYIPDVVKTMRVEGVEEAAVICLAPQNSRTSVGLYRRTVAAEAGALRIDFTAGWARHPQLIAAFAERLLPAWQQLCAEAGHAVPVLFTAHSVPVRTVEPTADGQPADPYAEEAQATAALVAENLPAGTAWRFAFQSQGQSGGAWIGPTVDETLDSLAAAGHKAVLLQPIGFLCDHVEILYDIDIAFREYAQKLGMRLERPASLNGSQTLAAALADLARNGLARLAGTS
jgi:ferrochelatase